MTEMIEGMERQNETQTWLQRVKEDGKARDRKNENRKKRRSILEEENERLRSLIRMSNIMK